MKLLKIPHSRSQDIVSHYQASTSVSEIIKENQSPFELIELCIDQKLFSDVVTFIAHGLPVREAVWWASSCANLLTQWNDDELNAIQAAKAWVNNPDEISRRYAEEMAKKSGLETGAGWAAQSAFWSNGSMTAPSDPIVQPPAYLYAQGVSGCINLCAILPDGANADQRYMDFIQMGLNIAQGGNGKI